MHDWRGSPRITLGVLGWVEMAGQATLIDMDYLQDMSGGDSEFIKEILSTFLESSVDLVDAIESAAREDDVDKALYATHTLKGSLKSIGAERVAALCQSLEVAARARDMASFHAMASEVPVGFDLLRMEICSLLQDEAA